MNHPNITPTRPGPHAPNHGQFPGAPTRPAPHPYQAGPPAGAPPIPIPHGMHRPVLPPDAARSGPPPAMLPPVNGYRPPVPVMAPPHVPAPLPLPMGSPPWQGDSIGGFGAPPPPAAVKPKRRRGRIIAAAIVAVAAPSLANVIWGYGAARENFSVFVPALVLFAPAIVLFTVHYMMLRGFYALEQTRRVFWVQCVIAVVNVSVALLLVGQASAENTAPALVVAYGVAYGAGALVSYSVLSRTVGGLGTARTLGFGVRLLVAVGVASGLAWGLRLLLEDHLALGSAKLEAIVTLGLLAAVLGGTVVLLARLLRIGEVNEVVDAVVRRVRPARRR